METVDQAMEALRRVESADDYRYQQAVSTNSAPDRKVGAYGILESRWSDLVEGIGYSGAHWQSRAMQDRVAKEKLKRDYQTLQNWDLAAVSFRFGMPVAKAMLDAGTTEPRDFEQAGYKEVGQYMRAVRKATPMTEMPVSGRVKPLGQDQGVRSSNPTQNKAQGIVRNHLTNMRDNLRKANGPGVGYRGGGGTKAEDKTESKTGIGSGLGTKVEGVTPDGNNEKLKPI